MARLVNAYTVQGDELQPGDEMVFIVKAMVSRRDGDGVLRYRLYRCYCDCDIDNMPQGSQVGDMKSVCEGLFPTLAAVGKVG